MIRLLSALALAVSLSVAAANAQTSDFSRGQLFNLEIKGPIALEEGANFSLPFPFSFPADARAGSTFGVDVSHHNFDQCRCSVDWSKASSEGVVFAFAKATQGIGFRDPAFSTNWKALESSNIHRGAYHFLTSTDDPTAQAKLFVDAVKRAGDLKSSDMPPSLDVEWDIRISGGKVVVGPDGKPVDFWKDVDPDEIARRMQVWLDYVERELGRTPMIYTSRAWWLGRIKDESLITKFAKYKIWIADYSKSGLAKETPSDFKVHQNSLWQFTEAGKVRGIAKERGGDLGVDVSIYNGTKEAFFNAFQLK